MNNTTEPSQAIQAMRSKEEEEEESTPALGLPAAPLVRKKITDLPADLIVELLINCSNLETASHLARSCSTFYKIFTKPMVYGRLVLAFNSSINGRDKRINDESLERVQEMAWMARDRQMKAAKDHASSLSLIRMQFEQREMELERDLGRLSRQLRETKRELEEVRRETYNIQADDESSADVVAATPSSTPTPTPSSSASSSSKGYGWTSSNGGDNEPDYGYAEYASFSDEDRVRVRVRVRVKRKWSEDSYYFEGNQDEDDYY